MSFMTLQKIQATGNDFLVVDARHWDPQVLVALASALCNRHKGIGADGLLLLGLPFDVAGGVDGLEQAHCSMRLINADGRDAEMSGNGIRALASFALSLGLGIEGVLRVDTAAGRRVLDLEIDGKGVLAYATVDMGAVAFDAQGIPTNTDETRGITREIDGVNYIGDAAGMGNPHWVLLVDDPANARVVEHGPILELDERFPNRTNVEFIAVTPGETNAITMRVWERGVGETLSCGTGACAAAAVANRMGLVGDFVTVHVRGGDLFVELGPLQMDEASDALAASDAQSRSASTHSARQIRLGGAVSHVAEVTVNLDLLASQI